MIRTLPRREASRSASGFALIEIVRNMVALSDGEQFDSFVSGFSGRCRYAVKSGICRGTEQARRRVRLLG